MPRMVAFLRGINVGGRRLTKDELIAAVTDLGMSAVATWRASGNVLFDTDIRDEEKLREALESGLDDVLGHEVPVLLREGPALSEIAGREPFDGRPGGSHQVIFMRSAPDASARERTGELTGPDEVLVIDGRELHWSPSAAVLDSEIDLDTIEALLGPTMMRTMNTVRGIAARLS